MNQRKEYYQLEVILIYFKELNKTQREVVSLFETNLRRNEIRLWSLENQNDAFQTSANVNYFLK